MKNNLRFSEVIFLLLLVLIIRLCFAYFANWLIWMVGWLDGWRLMIFVQVRGSLNLIISVFYDV